MAGSGGKRDGAGRKKGQRTQRTVELAKQAAAAGITPLEFMLQVMRSSMPEQLKDEENMDYVKRCNEHHDKQYQAAKDSAPYIHPRLTSIQTPPDKPLEVKVDMAEIAKTIAFMFHTATK